MSSDEAELIVLLLDGSASMATKNTPDNRRKVDALNDIVKNVLKRLQMSSQVNSFKISFIYFSTKVILKENGGRIYFPLGDAVNMYEDPIEVVGGEKTAIAQALNKACSVLDRFNSDEGVPANKRATVLLFTDGNEVIQSRDDVIAQANSVISHILSPALGTISFGDDADENLLAKIATQANERQIQHLRNANVYQHLPNRKKLFLRGHEQGMITDQKVNVIRNFVETLSKTTTAKRTG